MIKALSNITRETGDSVKLRCEVSGVPAPNRFRWYKNEAPVQEEKGRVIIRKYRTGSSVHGSRLRISDVDTHDTGYYKCEVSNGIDRIESTGIVIVRMGNLFIFCLSFSLKQKNRHFNIPLIGFVGAPIGQSGPIAASPNFQPSFPSFGGVPVR